MLQVAQEAVKKQDLCVIWFRIRFTSRAAVSTCLAQRAGWVGLQLSSYLLEFLTFLTWLWRLLSSLTCSHPSISVSAKGITIHLRGCAIQTPGAIPIPPPPAAPYLGP